MFPIINAWKREAQSVFSLWRRLSSPQQDDWNLAAQSVVFHNSSGDAYTVPGYYYFTYVNLPLARTGQPLVENAPGSVVTVPITTFAVHKSIPGPDNYTLQVVWLPFTGFPNAKVLIEWSNAYQVNPPLDQLTYTIGGIFPYSQFTAFFTRPPSSPLPSLPLNWWVSCRITPSNAAGTIFANPQILATQNS